MNKYTTQFEHEIQWILNYIERKPNMTKKEKGEMLRQIRHKELTIAFHSDQFKQTQD
jgi:hypothetical protein